MITIMWPCDRNNVWMTCDWQCHLNRPGYKAQYAGTDYAGPEQPLNPSQYNGKVLQAMWSNLGYGYTTFVEHYDQTGRAVLRIRNAHQKDLAVSTGDIVNPGDLLGTMDSTGNSTGTHTHWEVWLVINGQWQNIDPLAPKFGVTIVGNQSALEPLDGSEPPDIPIFSIPDAKFYRVKNITRYRINLRSAPFVTAGARVLGMVSPGSEWDYCGYKLDTLGNTWFAIRSGDKIGWAAANYNGDDWIVPIE
jgi:murein DD-endopeptidase MepM/ murein hydrolase activator NlpD